MGKRIFNRTGKLVAISLAIFFIITMTIASAKVVDVAIQNNAYNPSSVQVSTGDTLKWTNMDPYAHTVIGSPFKSGNINNGQSYQFKFNTPGTYNYTCSIHPAMKGTVIVK